jgi:hypothetical protein
MNWDCIACASLRPCRYAAPLRGRPMRSAGYAPIEENCRCVVLTQTINHFTYQINQQETPRNFNNEWDIPGVVIFISIWHEVLNNFVKSIKQNV